MRVGETDARLREWRWGTCVNFRYAILGGGRERAKTEDGRVPVTNRQTERRWFEWGTRGSKIGLSFGPKTGLKTVPRLFMSIELTPRDSLPGGYIVPVQVQRSLNQGGKFSQPTFT